MPEAHSEDKPFDTERKIWNYYYGAGKESFQRRRATGNDFKKLFPECHKESLRELARAFGERARLRRFGSDTAYRHLNQFHPDAFDIIADYGVDYIPLHQLEPPDVEPEPGRCHCNSLRIMIDWDRELAERPEEKDRRRFLYVEGLVAGAVAFPMLHAWNTMESERKLAFDWTFYASNKWIRYLGIPFTREEHASIARITGHNSIFDRRRFTRDARNKVLEILEPRLLSKQ